MGEKWNKCKKTGIVGGFFVCLLVLMVNLQNVYAETEGSGARIIVSDESGQARFHFGDEVGTFFYVNAEATGDKSISEVSFTSSDSAVCSVEATDDGSGWVVSRDSDC